jgi:RNA polymerase sigma-70 factor (ECF subfamily)
MAGESAQQLALAAAAAAVERARQGASGDTAFLADLDTQLMLQYRAGRPEAGSALIRRNFVRVTRFVGRLVRDQRIVEDLVQDVFVQVLTSANRYTASARFSTWLYCIATNTARTYLRRVGSQRRLAAGALDAVDPPDGQQRAPDHALNLDDLRRRVSAAIDKLPLNQRIALVLFETEDFTYAQIADALSVTVESVRALLARARETLREELAALR